MDHFKELLEKGLEDFTLVIFYRVYKRYSSRSNIEEKDQSLVKWCKKIKDARAKIKEREEDGSSFPGFPDGIEEVYFLTNGEVFFRLETGVGSPMIDPTNDPEII